MPSQQYKVHPAADMFPMMDPESFEALKADIKENGQNESIVFWGGQLVDGRNRMKACEQLGIEPQACELMEETDPFAYVISANLHRRHLAHEQRSMIAAEMATLKRGDVKTQQADGPQNCRPSTAEAAALMNVSPRSVDTAKAIKAKGSSELAQAVKDGAVNLNQATKLIKAVPDKKEQTKVVRDGKDAIKAATSKAKPEPKPKPSPAEKEPCESERDDYDYPIVKAFSQCDYRLNTLKRIVAELAPHEKTLLAEWLSEVSR